MNRMAEAAEALQAEIERLRQALLDLVTEAEKGRLQAVRPNAAEALGRASRILKRPGYC
jgi:hypothetical protein